MVALGEIYAEVTEAILRAEALPAGSQEEAAAFRRVSELEQRIAAETEPEGLEGAVARRGAVTAAMRAGDWRRAINLADAFLLESIPESLVEELSRLRAEASLRLSGSGSR
jgi:hypothetical protein